MKKILKLTASSLVAAFFAVSLNTGSALAHGHEEHEKETNSASSYEFVAKSGDSQSIFARRAIQLHADAKSIDLTKAAAMYCETNIVRQNLGNKLLDIGDRVTISVTDIEKYFESSKDLSVNELNRWNVYARMANFKLDNIVPVNMSESDDKDTKQTESENNKEEEHDSNGNPNGSGNQNKEGNSEASKDAGDSKPTSSWLIYAGAGVVALFTVYAVRSHHRSSGKK